MNWLDPRYSRIDPKRGVLVLTAEGARKAAEILRLLGNEEDAKSMDDYAKKEEVK